MITMMMITMVMFTMMMIEMLSREVHIKDSQETGQWPTTTLTLPKRGIFRAAVGEGKNNLNKTLQGIAKAVQCLSCHKCQCPVPVMS